MQTYKEVLITRNYKPQYTFPALLSGRQLVISDIHGCAKTFRALIGKISLTRKDQLFLLGDYINRGPDSAGVIDAILELLERGYNIWPLRGNHEEMLISSHHNAAVHKRRKYPSLYRYRGLVDDQRRILPKYRDFFYFLPYYIELPKYYLVHAGFDFQSPEPFRAFSKMPWIRPFHATLEQSNSKQIIIGHQPKPRPIINTMISQGQAVLYLDNGCVMKTQPLMGQLLCLNLQDQTITAQKNIEEEKR